MKKIIFAFAAVLSVSSVGFSAGTDAVLSCYSRAYSAKGALNWDAHSSVLLCTQVGSYDDGTAVINCAAQAIKLGGLTQEPVEVAILCSNVRH
jgi:hypothetical protein